MSTFSSFSVTTIGGKKCTAVPKFLKIEDKAHTIAVTTSTSSSSPATLTSRPTSQPTTFSTSSTPASASTLTSTAFTGGVSINEPTSDSSKGAQETLTSIASSTSSQSITSVIISALSSTRTTSPTVVIALPVSSETRSLATSSVTFSSSRTEDHGLSSTARTTDTLASSVTSDASLGSHVSTTDVLVGEISVTTSSGALASSALATSVSLGDATTAAAGDPRFGLADSSNIVATPTSGAQSTTGGGISTKTTAAIAGSVVGGLAAMSIIAFLVLFGRKWLKKNRRHALPTSLSSDAANGGGGEKGSYFMTRDSQGPTTIAEKVKIALGCNFHQLRGRVYSLVAGSPNPSVATNQRNSPFGPAARQTSNFNSGIGIFSNGSAVLEDRSVDWQNRQTEDGKLNSKPRNGQGSGPDDTFSGMSVAVQNRKVLGRASSVRPVNAQGRQHGAKNSTAYANHPRRSKSLGNNHLLHALELNSNPFGDSNAMSRDSAKVMPLSTANTTFSDANAIPAPPRCADNRNANSNRNTGVSTASTPSSYRESNGSVDTFDTRGTKFRSDPFDLDRPEFRTPYSAAVGMPCAPLPTHASLGSFTSKYSSGTSATTGWGEPGPDVGPGAGWWDMSVFPDAASGGRRTQYHSDIGSVGKAI
ncbi:hypothetical protein GGS21DRAFT_104196 [Xylaria nigripes]|nr:hypothetical protein GGS21DRAFT_104196 [Xylaria nigripes]